MLCFAQGFYYSEVKMKVHEYKGIETVEKYERLLTERLDKPVLIRTKSWLADDIMRVIGKIYVNEKYTEVDVDFDDLTEFERRGTLNFKLGQIVKNIKEKL